MYSSTIRLILASAITLVACAAENQNVDITSKRKASSSSESSLFVEITDVLKRGLPGYVELFKVGSTNEKSIRINLKDGKNLTPVPPAKYQAFIWLIS